MSITVDSALVVVSVTRFNVPYCLYYEHLNSDAICETGTVSYCLWDEEAPIAVVPTKYEYKS